MERAIRAVASVIVSAAVLLGVSAALPVAAQTAQTAAPEMRVRPVLAVDMARYQGKWYEIARYPNFFERNCARDAVAEYTPRPGGQIRIVTRCVKRDGGSEVSEGMAHPAGSEPNTARYKVSFAPDWLAWVPWVWGNFWVVVLDPNYRYAAIGEPGRNYLWILSRTPTLDVDTYHQIIAQLRAQGFDVDKLERAPQP